MSITYLWECKVFARLPSPSALRTFESAARLGSFKAAAAELNVTATAVSHQIRALEDQLSVPLFVRKTRFIELTPAGRELAPVLTRALLDIRNALENVVSKEVIITVSTSSSFATLWLVPRLLKFYAMYPDYRVQLDTTTKPVNLKQDRRIDVAIRYGRGSYDDLDEVPLFEEAFGAYVSPTLLPLDDGLGDLKLIETAWQQDVLHDINWKAWLTAANEETANTRVVSFNEEEHVVQAAIAGQGIALVSSILVDDLVKRGLLVPYRSDVHLSGATYTALCLPEQKHAQKIHAFLTWLTTVDSGAEGD